MPPEIDYQTCMRYVRRKCSPAEAYAVRAWLADPANAQQAQAWMTSYAQQVDESEADDIENSFDYTGMRQSLHARLGLTKPDAVPRSRAWQRWAAAAAVVATLAGGGWLWQGQHQPAAVATTSYSTPYGQTRVVQLPDGSTATLNAHSKLRYAASADAETPREVWLEGEAYFSVKHLPDNKHFVVHTTGGFNVEVLGTKFTVYRRHAQARVVLLSGKVRVAFKDDTLPDVILKPGELLQTADNQAEKAVHKAVQAGSYATWTANKLSFDATSLAELATRLQDTYGVEVVVTSPELNQRKFTGTFPMNDLNVLCENLAETFHLRVTRQQNRLLLSAK